MLADFDASLKTFGPSFYRHLFWETGMVGQMLYLEAEAAGARATGIGCFYDDPVHDVLGLRGHAFQSLYHFTVGAPVDDARLTTEPGYSWEENQPRPQRQRRRRPLNQRVGPLRNPDGRHCVARAGSCRARGPVSFSDALAAFNHAKAAAALDGQAGFVLGNRRRTCERPDAVAFGRFDDGLEQRPGRCPDPAPTP